MSNYNDFMGNKIEHNLAVQQTAYENYQRNNSEPIQLFCKLEHDDIMYNINLNINIDSNMTEYKLKSLIDAIHRSIIKE